MILTALAFALAVSASPAPAAAPASGPLIIGHRGASGHRPEHTASSYRLAIQEGADYIEPDLVMTKDGQLIARHENEIGATTDVAAHPEFAGRKTTKTIDGRAITGWFSEDFTLAEIKTLRARERLPQLRPGNAAYDGRDPILTLAEVIALSRDEGAKAGRTIGVYAELKHPTYFASIGLPMEARLAAVLKAQHMDGRGAPFFLECFETGALKKVRALAPHVRTIFLMDEQGAPADLAAAGDKRTYAQLARPDQLKQIAAFATGIGPAKAMVIPRSPEGRSLPATTLVADAHAAGLLVHPWTMRPENYFLPLELRRGDTADKAYPALHGESQPEYLALYDTGIDGLFSDVPDEAVAARKVWLAGKGR